MTAMLWCTAAFFSEIDEVFALHDYLKKNAPADDLRVLILEYPNQSSFILPRPGISYQEIDQVFPKHWYRLGFAFADESLRKIAAPVFFRDLSESYPECEIRFIRPGYRPTAEGLASLSHGPAFITEGDRFARIRPGAEKSPEFESFLHSVSGAVRAVNTLEFPALSQFGFPLSETSPSLSKVVTPVVFPPSTQSSQATWPRYFENSVPLSDMHRSFYLSLSVPEREALGDPFQKAEYFSWIRVLKPKLRLGPGPTSFLLRTYDKIRRYPLFGKLAVKIYARLRSVVG